jgi:multiple sugar transport system ATP-binding protein
MAKVELKNICKTYDGGVKAVESVNITIQDREFVVFVGPSGCGKTTTLRMVAGLESITGGELCIDGIVVNDVAPKDRDIAMVFQNYALYPHMTVYENMAFALRIRKVEPAEIDRRVRMAATILDIEHYLERKPKALSGGQRQRVALGRAIVRNPKVFLFDEPLSNLDAKLRVQMRAEISELHHRLKATMIYVTHDQVEAMTMGDKIVVMKDGKINQSGSPLYLYNRPINKFVAGFIGSPPMNFINVRVVEESGEIQLAEETFQVRVARDHQSHLKPYIGKEVYFGIRPEDLVYQEHPVAGNDLPAKVTVIEPLGAEIHLYVATPTHSLIARVPPHHQFKIENQIHFAPTMDKAHFFDKDTGMSILPVKWDEQA